MDARGDQKAPAARPPRERPPEGLGKSGIGLHGYTLEEPALWLERLASNGCLRLRQDDVDRVFHLALEGTPVWLVE